MDEEVFVDAEGYQGSSYDKISFKIIVLNHLNRIALLGSKEWRGGHWEQRHKVTGGIGFTEKYYVPSTAEEFSNAVFTLMDLVLPRADKKMLAAEESINKELEELKDSAKKEQWSKEKIILEKVVVARKLFRQLSLLLARLKYLEAMRYEE